VPLGSTLGRSEIKQMIDRFEVDVIDRHRELAIIRLG
jgi:hypothetical protein